MGHSDPPTMRRTPMFRQLDAHLSALQELLGGGICACREAFDSITLQGASSWCSVGPRCQHPVTSVLSPAFLEQRHRKSRALFSAGVRHKRMLHRGWGVLVGWESGGTCRGPCSLVSQRRVKMLSTSWLNTLLPFQSAGRKLETILCFGSKPG